MKKKRMIQLLAALTLMCGCTSTPSSKTSTQEVYKNMDLTSNIFDTTYAYQEGPKTDKSSEHYEQSLKELKEYSDLFDIYNNYDGINNLKTINDMAGKEPVEVDQRIIDMLLMAKDFYDLSNGEFDVTIGSILKVWHNYREVGIQLNEEGKQAPIPSQTELDLVKDEKGWDKVIIDDENNTVFITDSNVSLDVGGIAKGYAAEQVAKDLENENVSGGFVNVGRNIRLLGAKMDGSAWRIGITDPSSETGDSLLAVDVDPSSSIVTSGDYERYYIGVDGNRYAHIIDPATLYPATLYHSVTIITADSGVADCLSTTLYTMSIDEGKEVLKKYSEQSGNKVSAIWIKDNDGTGKTVGNYSVEYTDDLEDTILWY